MSSPKHSIPALLKAPDVPEEAMASPGSYSDRFHEISESSIALISGACEVVGNRLPVKFQMHGRVYWIRLSIGIGKIEIYDSPEMTNQIEGEFFSRVPVESDSEHFQQHVARRCKVTFPLFRKP